MAGIVASSNWTSTAGPDTWITLPMFSAITLLSLLERRCAGNDLDDFLGDGRLAHAIHVERERVDHVRGVVGCRIHRRHAGRMLRGNRLSHGVVQHGRDVL